MPTTCLEQPDNAELAGSPLADRLDLSLGYTKYLKESRTEIEIEGKNGAKRGGWDKLRSEAEIQAALDNGSPSWICCATTLEAVNRKMGTSSNSES